MLYNKKMQIYVIYIFLMPFRTSHTMHSIPFHITPFLTKPYQHHIIHSILYLFLSYNYINISMTFHYTAFYSTAYQSILYCSDT